MNKLVATGALALALAAGGGYWLSTQSAGPAVSEAPGAIDMPGAANAQESGEAVDTSSVVEMALGPEDAAVTIYEYASFTCPHCATFHKEQFKKLKTDYIDTGKIRFVYRDVFFDRFGLWASMVARCGGEQKFFGISDMIYEQQRDWIGSGSDPVEIANNLRKIGKVAGLSDDQVEACLSDADRAKTLVAWYQENSETHDISSTPTLIINGKKHSNMPYSELSGLIDDLLGE